MTYSSSSLGVNFIFLLDLMGPCLMLCFGTLGSRELSLSPSILGPGEET